MLRQLLAIGPLFLFVAAASARESKLFVSSVSYCGAPSELLVDKLDVTFFKANHSVVFSIIAEATQSLELSGRAVVNAYSLTPVDLNFDLCGTSPILCPIPQYTFNGSATIPIDTSFTHRIPGIAYIVPDLEAYIELSLIDDKTHEEVACIQSTVSNGLTTRIKSISWATGGVAIAAVLAGIVATIYSLSSPYPARVDFTDKTKRSYPNPIAWQFSDYVMHIQHIVLSGLLNINYPVIYTSFTLNFAWSFGLFTSDPVSSNIQASIDSLRERTGSADVGAALNPLVWGERGVSPYNVAQGGTQASSLNSLFKRGPEIGIGMEKRLVNYQYAHVTQYVKNASTLDPGFPTYVNSLGISTRNAGMSMFFTVLMLIAVLLGCFVIGWGALWVWTEYFGKEKRRTVPEGVRVFRDHYWDFVVTLTLRVVMTILLPVMTLTFFQWTLHDAWLPDLLLALLFLWLISILLLAGISTTLSSRRPSPSPSHSPEGLSTSALSEGPTHARFAALIAPFRSSAWHYTLTITLPSLFLKALFVSSAHASGWTQVLALLIIELASLIATCVLRPRYTKGGDAVLITLGILRVVGTGLLLAFERSLGVKPIVRVVLGAGGIVVQSVGVLVLVGVLLWNGVVHPVIKLVRGWRRERKGEDVDSEAAAAAAEKTEDLDAVAVASPTRTREDADAEKGAPASASAQERRTTMPPTMPQRASLLSVRSSRYIEIS